LPASFLSKVDNIGELEYFWLLLPVWLTSIVKDMELYPLFALPPSYQVMWLILDKLWVHHRELALFIVAGSSYLKSILDNYNTIQYICGWSFKVITEPVVIVVHVEKNSTKSQLNTNWASARWKTLSYRESSA
jgi:hypothetical protein